MAIIEGHADRAELNTVLAAIPQLAEANLGATVGEANNAASATLVALKSELDTTNTKLNSLLTKLRSAGIIAP